MNLIKIDYKVIFAELETIKLRGYRFDSDDMRCVMNEKTMSILVENQKEFIKNDYPIIQPRISGMKIIIDNTIPYGDVKIFIDSLAL